MSSAMTLPEFTLEFARKMEEALVPEVRIMIYKHVLPGPRFVPFGPLSSLYCADMDISVQSTVWDHVSDRAYLPLVSRLSKDARALTQGDLKLCFHEALKGRPLYFNDKIDTLLILEDYTDVFAAYGEDDDDEVWSEEKKQRVDAEKQLIAEKVRSVAFCGNMRIADVMEHIVNAFPNIKEVWLADTIRANNYAIFPQTKMDAFVSGWQNHFSEKPLPKIKFLDIEDAYPGPSSVHIWHVEDNSLRKESHSNVSDWLCMGHELSFDHRKGLLPDGPLPGGRYPVDAEYEETQVLEEAEDSEESEEHEPRCAAGCHETQEDCDEEERYINQMDEAGISWGEADDFEWYMFEDSALATKKRKYLGIEPWGVDEGPSEDDA